MAGSERALILETGSGRTSEVNTSSENTKERDQELLCTTDAGHPRFQRKKKSTEKCYCPLCDLYLEDTHVAREMHFTENHASLDKCQYCQKKVFQFRRREENSIHHHCKYDSPSIYSSSSSIGEPSPSTSTSCTMTADESVDEPLQVIVNGNLSPGTSSEASTSPSDPNCNSAH